MKKYQKHYPLSYGLYKNRTIKNIVDYFDSVGIRILLHYSANGGFGLTIYRSKSKNEIEEGKSNWEMIRIPYINSYYTRKEAVDFGISEAFRLHEEILKVK